MLFYLLGLRGVLSHIDPKTILMSKGGNPGKNTSFIISLSLITNTVFLKASVSEVSSPSLPTGAFFRIDLL